MIPHWSIFSGKIEERKDSMEHAIVSEVRTQPSRLRIAREDLLFLNILPETVRLAVTVRNPADTASDPAWMHVAAAPFGAFLATTPLGRVQVPSIPAGSLTVVHAEFADPRHGGDSELPLLPRTEEPPRVQQGRRPHWAGNVHVYIGRAEAERHCARAVQLKPGRSNFSLFEVGDRSDAYRFHFRGEGAGWSPMLMVPRRGQVPDDGRWISLRPRTVVGLHLSPPADIEEGQLGVEVEQRSTGRRALVEFAFGSETLPPRCFATLG